MRRSSVLEICCRSVGPSSRSELASLLLYQDWGVKYDGEDCQVKKKKRDSIMGDSNSQPPWILSM